jgi:protein-tyrosine phosphatase
MDISRITASLFVSAQPRPADVLLLQDLNIGLVISMRGEIRPDPVFSQPPLASLWLRTYDTFLTPIPLPALEQGVRAALPLIAQGGRVLVHCHHGRHRSVAQAAAILIAQGYTAPDAMSKLRAERAAADPHIWYIRRRIEIFERHWKALPAQ